jgi:hypothetical protein
MNQYDDALDQLADAPQEQNPYLTTIDRMGQGRRIGLQSKIQQDDAPDQKRAKDILDLSKRTGLPAEFIARNFDRYKSGLVIDWQETDKLLEAAPGLAGWLEKQDKVRIGAVRDDIRPLAGLERVFRNTAGAVGAGLMGFNEGIWGALQSASELAAAYHPGDPRMATAAADYFRQRGDDARYFREQSRGAQAGAGFIEKSVYQGIESVGQMAPGLVMSAFTGGAGPALTAAGTTTGGQSYAEARREGLSPIRAAQYGAVQGAIEVATEKLPVSWLLRDLKQSAPLIKTLAHQAMGEVPGEQIATVLQDFNDWITLPSNADRTLGDYLRDRPSAAASTLISTIAAVGLTTSGAHLTAKMLEKAGESAQESKTIKELPEVAQAALAEGLKGSPIEYQHVDLSTFTEFFQTKGVNPAEMAETLTGSPRAFVEAQETGESIRIPTATYLVHIAANPEFADLRHEVRRTPEALNAREEAALADELAAKEPAPGADTTATAPSPIFTHAREQFMQGGRITTQSADHFATLMDAFFTRISQPLGMDPAALYQRYGLSVTRKVSAQLEQAQSLNQESRTLFQRTVAAVKKLTGQKADATLTPAFGLWFGNSQTVNEAGKPLVLYHGSNRRFDAFESKPAFRRDDDGEVLEVDSQAFFFSEDRDVARTFARDRVKSDQVMRGGKGGRAEVRSFYVRMENPLDLRQTPAARTAMDAAGYSPYYNPAAPNPIAAEIFESLDYVLNDWVDVQKALDDPNVIELLKSEGYDGVILEDEGAAAYAVFDPTQVKSTNNTGTFDAENPNIFQQGERAALRIDDKTLARTMVLFQEASFDSVIHESAHLFLDVFADVAGDVAAIPVDQHTPEQARTLTDFSDILTWTGYEGSLADWLKLTTDEKRAYHEKFAEAFVNYTKDGKAPSNKLRAAFARFRSWILALAKHLRPVVEFSPETRQIIDRMLATDAEIEQVIQQSDIGPMFLTPEKMGYTPERFALYKETVKKAHDESIVALETKLLDEVRREQTQEWRERKREIQRQVEAEVFAEPVYQALAAVRKGTTPTGQSLIEGEDPVPMKFNRAGLVQTYGPERVARLPKGIATNDGGLTATDVADLFGFDSGDALLTALEQAEPMRQKITRQTDERMLAEHGSMLLDGTLHEEARAAIINTSAEEVVREELRALHHLRRTVKPFVEAEQRDAERELAYERRWFDAEAKLREAIIKGKAQAEIDALREEVRDLKAKARGGAVTIRGAVPDLEFFERQARERLNRTRVVDIQPHRFWVAARQASKEATEQAGRHEFDRAIAAKQRELLNLALFRQSMALQDEVRKRAKFARDLAKPKQLAKVGLGGQAYVDQIRDILGRYEFVPMTGQQIASRLANIEIHAELPDALNTPKAPYQTLSVEEFIGITDGLTQIVHAARLENRFITAGNKAVLSEVALEGSLAIRANTPAGPTRIEFSRADERRRFLGDWIARHTKISEFAHELDGDTEGGWMWEHVIRPLNERQAWEDRRKAEAATAYLNILRAHYTASEIARFGDKVEIPAIGRSLSKEARIVIARNWGNPQGRARLLSDPVLGWNEAQYRAILDTLDERDWRAIQATWDFLDTFWPEIAEKQERVVGLAPEKVEALPVETKFGTFKGGYYPLVYDHRKAPKVKELNEKSELKAAIGYAGSTTRRGHTKARLEHVELPLLLEDTVGRHVDQVLHDLAFHETLIDMNRLLGHKDIRNAIVETKGDQVYEQFTRTVRDVAVGYTGATVAEDHVATWMKSGVQIVGLGYNAWTAAQQVLGNFNTVALFGARNYARGFKSLTAHPDGISKRISFAFEHSAILKTRAGNLNQDVADLHRTLRKHGSWFEKALLAATNDTITQDHITNSFMWHIGMAQLTADLPAWFTGYERAMRDPANKGDESRAFALADQAVIDAQGTGSIHDLAAVQRGGPVLRLFLVFYSYGNLVFNQTRRVVARTDPYSPTQVGKMLRDLSLIYILPSAFATALAVAVGREDPEDEEEFFREIAKDSVQTAMNSMIYVREVGGIVSSVVTNDDGGVRGYEGPAGTRFFKILERSLVQARQGEVDEALIKSLSDLTGTLLHLPTAQVERSARGAVALLEGRTNNPAALVFGPPPKEK